MTDMPELLQRFRDFAATATSRAPLYSELSRGVAGDAPVAAVLQSAPEPQQLPVLLFAAVHHLLLGGHGRELASHYPNLAARPPEGSAYRAFREFVLENEVVLRELVALHSTQTNEVGRCAALLPALHLVEREQGPLALVDVGTSAGLNLLLGHYSYEYLPGGRVGSPSAVSLRCSTRGAVPVPTVLPRLAGAIGIDRTPVDIHDDDAVRWLEACIWPDQGDRMARLAAAIEIARKAPPDVRQGDALDDLAATVTEAATMGHPVVSNTWVLNYLTGDQRLRYVATLDAIGAERDLSWVFAESPAQTPELPVVSTDDGHLTVLSLVTWRRGQRSARRLASCHPHGFWMHWEDGA